MKIELISKVAILCAGSKVIDAAVSNCKKRAVFFDKNNKFRLLEHTEFKVINEKVKK